VEASTRNAAAAGITLLMSEVMRSMLTCVLAALVTYLAMAITAYLLKH
jgi:hypothetical protein